jgi:hypothetical protein
MIKNTLGNSPLQNEDRIVVERKNVPSEVSLKKLSDYVANAVSTSTKAYCVFSDAATGSETFITGLDTLINCELYDDWLSGINSGDFVRTEDAKGVKYIGTETINVIINVALSGFDKSTNADGIAYFAIYKNGYAIDSSLCISSPYLASSFPILCGTTLVENDEMKIFARAKNLNFSFELVSINISITQV